MQFELTKSYLDDLSAAITTRDGEKVLSLVGDLHPADIAEVFDKIPLIHASFVYHQLPEELASETLTFLPEDILEKVLAKLTPEEIADRVDDMETDDAADVLGELDLAQQAEVISRLEDKEHSEDISHLLSYPEDSAGGLMAKEFISANVNWPVDRCVVNMRKQAEQVGRVYSIYVVDDNDVLIGTLSLKSLLFASPKTLIQDLYMEGAISVKAEEGDEKVAKIMEKYDLVVLPVVDDAGKLIGRITIDDVVDVIKGEAEKDYQMASGISDKIDSNDSVWRISRARLPWLLVGMLGGIFGAEVIGKYEHQIQLLPELAYFIPLVAAMGGNVGVQSSAIVVQGLANKSINFSGIAGRLSKETLVAVFNGLICSLVIFGYNVVVGNDQDLAWTVSLALLTVIIFAAVFGTFIPLFLDRYKVDAALATGPFITTLNDVLGLFIYFLIGKMMYGI